MAPRSRVVPSATAASYRRLGFSPSSLRIAVKTSMASRVENVPNARVALCRKKRSSLLSCANAARGRTARVSQSSRSDSTAECLTHSSLSLSAAMSGRTARMSPISPSTQAAYSRRLGSASFSVWISSGTAGLPISFSASQARKHGATAPAGTSLWSPRSRSRAGTAGAAHAHQSKVACRRRPRLPVVGLCLLNQLRYLCGNCGRRRLAAHSRNLQTAGGRENRHNGDPHDQRHFPATHDSPREGPRREHQDSNRPSAFRLSNVHAASIPRHQRPYQNVQSAAPARSRSAPPLPAARRLPGRPWVLELPVVAPCSADWRGAVELMQDDGRSGCRMGACLVLPSDTLSSTRASVYNEVVCKP